MAVHACILLFLSGCAKNSSDSGQAERKTETDAALPVIHLLLETEPSDNTQWFREISFLGNSQKAEAELYPWPLSVRISDIAGTDEGAAVCVNGKGIAFFSPAGGKSRISYIAVEDFAKKTTGNIIKKENSILCHIYKNTFFTDDLISDDSAPFVEIDLKDNSVKKFVPESPVFPSGYSLTELNLKEEIWYSAWKQSDKSKTVFRYFTHTTPGGENLKEITEAVFKSSVRELDKSNAPVLLKKSLDHLLETKGGTKKIIDLTLRSPYLPAPVSYSVNSQNGNREKYEKINAAAGDEKYYFAYGKGIFTAENNKISMLEIDKLPEDYYYTALYYQDGKLYAAWEQQQFYLTGEAGLSIIDEKKVDKITQ